MNCRSIIRTLFVLSLATLLAVACEDPSLQDDPDMRTLSLQLYVPDGAPDPATKAGGSVAFSAESKLYDVRVWVYEHKGEGEGDEDLPISFNLVTGLNSGSGWQNTENLPNGSGYYGASYWLDDHTLKIDLNIPGKVLDWPESRMKVDFYILANAASLHLLKPTGTNPFTTSPLVEDPYTLPRGTLRSLVFGGSDFFAATEVPSGGLPFTGFYNRDKQGQANGVDISFMKNIGSLSQQQALAQMYDHIPIIQLSRAVSRIRLVFSRLKDMGYVQIDAIRLASANDPQEGIIPNYSYVFPRGSVVLPDPAPTYLPVTLPGLLNHQIPGVLHPEDLRSDNYADQQAYEAFLNEDLAKTSGRQTVQQFLYVRETDGPLAVVIDYTFFREAEDEGDDGGGQASEEHHTIVAPLMVPDGDGLSQASSFPRNNSATLYAYFLEDTIRFRVSWDEWDDQNITHTNLTP